MEQFIYDNTSIWVNRGFNKYYPEYKNDIKSLTGTILFFLFVVGGVYCLTLFSFQETIILSIFNNQITFELYCINIFIVIEHVFSFF